MEYSYSEGMSQEMSLGNLRWAQVHSIMCVCVCEIFSCSKNVNRGNVARRKYIETKGWKIAEENTISLIHKIQA